MQVIIDGKIAVVAHLNHSWHSKIPNWLFTACLKKAHCFCGKLAQAILFLSDCRNSNECCHSCWCKIVAENPLWLILNLPLQQSHQMMWLTNSAKRSLKCNWINNQIATHSSVLSLMGGNLYLNAKFVQTLCLWLFCMASLLMWLCNFVIHSVAICI